MENQDLLAEVRYAGTIAHIVLLLIFLLTIPSAAIAEPSNPDSVQKPISVQIGIKLEQIVNIDQKAENFTAVYTLRLRYRDAALAFERPPEDPPFKMLTVAGVLAKIETEGLLWPAFVLENQQGRRDVNSEIVEIHPDGEVRLYERATATFQAPDFDFRRFPLDEQIFHIRALLVAPNSLFTFEPLAGFSGVGDHLGEEEWVVFDSSAQTDMLIVEDGTDRSRFSLSFKAHRHIVYYIVRILIPMIIILLVSWFTFRLKDYGKRIDLGITVLLVFIAFNFTLGSDLPRLGYLTFVDVFIAGTFAITGAVILVNVQLRLLERQGREREAERLDRIAMIGYWPAYLVGMSTALLVI